MAEIVEEKEFKKWFPNTKHIFTNVDYIEYYKEIIEEAGAEAVMLFGNNERNVLKYTKNILVCSIHTRVRTKEKLKKAGAEKIFCLSEILDAPFTVQALTKNMVYLAQTSLLKIK